MLPSLLILSVCLQLAWTCLPMKPAEDMHCPSVPLAAAVADYAVNGLMKSIVNGAEPKALLLEVDGTNVKEIDGGKISCMPNSGIFVDGNMKAVNQKTYNCGKMAKCDNCMTEVKSFFQGGGSDPNNPVPANPVCVTTCADGFDIYVNNMRHDKVLCNMATEKVTVDSVGGEMLSDGNKFTCVGCECLTGELNDGKAGLCPPDKLCGMPTGGTACKAACPPGSQALYKDKTTDDLKKSQSIQCPTGAMDWFADYDKDAGITCQYDDGKGYSTEPPEVLNKCPKLEELTCPTVATDCAYSEIIYVEDGTGGFKAMCKNGRLITDTNVGEDGIESLCPASELGMWLTKETKATCLIGGADLVKMCTTMVPPIFKAACSFGSCSLTCTAPGQKFMYDLSGGPAGQTSAYLLCTLGDLTDTSRLAYPLKNTVKCV